MSGCIEVPEGADLDTTMFEFKGNIELTVYIIHIEDFIIHQILFWKGVTLTFQKPFRLNVVCNKT